MAPFSVLQDHPLDVLSPALDPQYGGPSELDLDLGVAPSLASRGSTSSRCSSAFIDSGFSNTGPSSSSSSLTSSCPLPRSSPHSYSYSLSFASSSPLPSPPPSSFYNSSSSSFSAWDNHAATSFLSGKAAKAGAAGNKNVPEDDPRDGPTSPPLQPIVEQVGDAINFGFRGVSPKNGLIGTNIGQRNTGYYCMHSKESPGTLPETLHPALSFQWPIKNVHATLMLLGPTGQPPKNNLLWDAEFAVDKAVSRVPIDMVPQAGMQRQMKKICLKAEEPNRVELHVTGIDPRDELFHPKPPPRPPPIDLGKKPDRTLDEWVQFEIKLVPGNDSRIAAMAASRTDGRTGRSTTRPKRYPVWGPYISVGSVADDPISLGAWLSTHEEEEEESLLPSSSSSSSSLSSLYTFTSSSSSTTAAGEAIAATATDDAADASSPAFPSSSSSSSIILPSAAPNCVAPNCASRCPNKCEYYASFL